MFTGSGLIYLRNDNDANCTYEGDNNVLLQQTSNWLIGVWKNRSEMSVAHPMGTVDYFDQGDHILRQTWMNSPINEHSTNLGKIMFFPANSILFTKFSPLKCRVCYIKRCNTCLCL